jgi:hypothetical protein
MKTNFKNKRNLVLSTGNDQILAVIECKLGLYKFKNKLIQAISTTFFANKVIVHADITILENATIHIFKVTLYHNNNSKEEYFKLSIAPVY